MIARGGGDLTGNVALVTGAGSGIGRATALLLAERGARVAVVARGDNGVETCEAIRARGGIAEHVVADMRQPEAIAGMIGEAVERLGGLHIAVNNAGTTGLTARLHEQTVDSWSDLIATDLTGVFLCMKYQIAHMLAHGGGAIVNNASGAGVAPQPFLSPYAAAKHGVLGLTKTAAREYATDGIRVNAVCPGLTMTDQLQRYFNENPAARDAMVASVPMQRVGSTEEIARAIVWLCSDESSYVSGESLFVDGAYTCH